MSQPGDGRIGNPTGLAADIIEFLSKTNLTYTSIKIDSRNVYLHGVISDADSIQDAIKIINMRHMIINIVEPDRDITYKCLKLHFTPYIENERIVWSYW